MEPNETGVDTPLIDTCEPRLIPYEFTDTPEIIEFKFEFDQEAPEEELLKETPEEDDQLKYPKEEGIPDPAKRCTFQESLDTTQLYLQEVLRTNCLIMDAVGRLAQGLTDLFTAAGKKDVAKKAPVAKTKKGTPGRPTKKEPKLKPKAKAKPKAKRTTSKVKAKKVRRR